MVLDYTALVPIAAAIATSLLGWWLTRRRQKAETYKVTTEAVGEITQAAERAVKLANEQAERSQRMANRHLKDLNTVRANVRELEKKAHELSQANVELMAQLEIANKRLSKLEVENKRLRKRLEDIRQAIKGIAPGVNTDRLFDSREFKDE